MAVEMLRFERVSKRYGQGQDALRDVSFSVPAGEMVFLTGHSGAGKSTALKLLMRHERPSAGTLWFQQRDLGRLPERQVPAVRRQMGPVFQDHRLLLDRPVFDNVALPLVIAGQRRAEIEGSVHRALEQVGLPQRARAYPSQLSAGEQQRIGIARAIVANPALIVADEPTGNLDPNLAHEIMQLFASLSRSGATVLVASHDLRLIAQLRKRVLVLEHGALIDDFRPAARAAPAQPTPEAAHG